MFNATTGVVSVPAAGGPICMFQNPATSGVDLYFYRLMCTSRYAGRFERLRGAVPVLASGAVPKPALNRSGASLAAKARLYAGDQFTHAQGTLGKTIFVPDNATYHSDEEGSIILPPGSTLVWNFIPDVYAGASKVTPAAFEIVWWEVPA